jgi:hypothetical protein
MTLALRSVGSALRYLPDGETGERDTWVVGTINRLRSHPDLRVSREGQFTNYTDQPRFTVRSGHRLTGQSLDLGYAAAYRASRPVFDRLRAQFGRPDLSFQVGLPGDLDLALFSMGPIGTMRHRKAFTDALGRELSEIRAEAADDVLFQIEVPAETVAVARAPRLARPALARWLGATATTLARRAPEGARFGVHLCLGDLGHQALAKPSDTTALVQLGNAIISRWPPARPLEYLHIPLAAGTEPPPLDAGFYQALAGLRLPRPTRFVAGCLHEARTVDQLRQILGHVEAATGRTVDVAAACGLARRGPEAANIVLRQTAELCRAHEG